MAQGQLNVLRDGDLSVLDLGVRATAASLKPCGNWLIAAFDGIYDYDGQASKRWPAPPFVRFNDGACDALGRFWVGSMGLNGLRGAGQLFRVDQGLTPLTGGFDVCNGIAFSPDNHWLYLVDTGPRVIWKYKYDLIGGNLGDRSMVTCFPQEMGKPDGIAVDNDGNIWSAMWDGGRLVKVSPDGDYLQQLAVPAPRPTSLAIGPDAILVTTAKPPETSTAETAHYLSGKTFFVTASVSANGAYRFAF